MLFLLLLFLLHILFTVEFNFIIIITGIKGDSNKPTGGITGDDRIMKRVQPSYIDTRTDGELLLNWMALSSPFSKFLVTKVI